jgi:2'-5' RNA ligase
LTQVAPAPARRGERLLVTAELPSDVLAFADALRREHYPPGRMRLGAHVTLFHALPPSAEDTVRRALGDLARAPSPEARISGVMDLDEGTALAVDSEAIVAIHAELGERLYGFVQQKDNHRLRPHITVQNKVGLMEARKLQRQLAASLTPRTFRFRGFGLYKWRDELWRLDHLYAFRG